MTLQSKSEFEEIELKEKEKEGLNLIRNSDNKIYQSDFWKELDISSRKGSRIVKKLEDEGLIERTSTVYNGHNTYELQPIYHARDLDFTLLMAGNMISPFIGEEETDAHSESFTKWLMNLTEERPQK